MREKKARARREVVEEEELLLCADKAVVTLLRLGDVGQIRLHLLRVREGDSVYALQRIVLSVAKPVPSGGETTYLRRNRVSGGGGGRERGR